MGYHKTNIVKGVLGDMSKVSEEFFELLDAHEQNNPILVLCELADVLGAIEAYTVSKYNITLNQIYIMTKATKSAFEDGTRKQ